MQVDAERVVEIPLPGSGLRGRAQVQRAPIRTPEGYGDAQLAVQKRGVAHDTIHQGGRDVTELLQEAFARVARLPDDEQNALARWLMDELESERRWSRAYETSQGQLAELAREALGDHHAGRTEPLDPDRL